MRKRRGADRNNVRSSRGRLRIVAGKWRSRLLPIADVPGLRPTPERVRETLFNWLTPVLQGARCLDLFAGTGALGFEALSRGAARVHFVERSAMAAATIRENIAKLQAAGASISETSAFDYLQERMDQPYDLVFLDPPFADDRLGELCRLLQDNGFVGAGGRVYLERSRDQAAPELPAAWAIGREKSAGNVHYSLAEIA